MRNTYVVLTKKAIFPWILHPRGSERQSANCLVYRTQSRATGSAKSLFRRVERYPTFKTHSAPRQICIFLFTQRRCECSLTNCDYHKPRFNFPSSYFKIQFLMILYVIYSLIDNFLFTSSSFHLFNHFMTFYLFSKDTFNLTMLT